MTTAFAPFLYFPEILNGKIPSFPEILAGQRVMVGRTMNSAGPVAEGEPLCQS